MKKCLLVLVFALVAVPAFAQAPAKWWSTDNECLNAVDAPIYEPPLSKKPCRLMKGDEIVGVGRGGCFKMKIAEAGGASLWVRRVPPYPMILNRETGEWVADSKCCNDVEGFVPFPPAEKPEVAPTQVNLDTTGVVGAIDRASARISGTIAEAANRTAATTPLAEPQKPKSPPKRSDWINPTKLKGLLV